MDYLLAIKSLIAGIGVGLIFTKLRLPIPAPPVFSGIMGIFGVILGGMIVGWFL